MRKMKLGAKIFSGFAAILVLMLIAIASGFMGMLNSEDRVSKAQDMAELSSLITTTRQFEKNYIIRDDEGYAAKVGETLATLEDRAAAVKAGFKDQLNRDQVDAISAAVADYKAGFASYARQHKALLETTTAIEAQAREALEEIEHLRNAQKAELTAGLTKSGQEITDVMNNGGDMYQVVTLQAELAALVQDKLTKADEANRMIKWFLTARKEGKDYLISRGDEKSLTANRDLLSAITKQAKDMLTRTAKAENKEHIGHILAATAAYGRLMDSYAEIMAGQKAADQQMVAAARKVQEVCAAAKADQMAKAEAAQTLSHYTMGTAALVALLAGLVLALLITRSITGPINKVIAGLAMGADQVASAAHQVSGASQSLAEGASQQAAALEETSSSLEEMGSMTRRNADAAKEADELMNEAGRVIHQAAGSMADMRQAMEKITKASDETAKIIKTIDEIAFQTNLLALNAAVEAARAGEAGAGFAVVADEVRSLAMRAAEAAKTTQDLIEGNLNNVRAGSQLVARTDEAFGQVQASSIKVGDLISEIAAANDEQAMGIQHITQATSEMDQVTQQNAANAEESAAASQQLSAQSVQMQSFVGELMEIVGKAEGAERQPRGRIAKAARAASGLPRLTGKGRAREVIPALPKCDYVDDDAFTEF